MNLRNANICLSCDEITSNEICEICASSNIFPVRKWIMPLKDDTVKFVKQQSIKKARVKKYD